jgi:hypothetical protein
MDFEFISKSIYLVQQCKTINREGSLFAVDFSYCRVDDKLKRTDGHNVLGLFELWLADGRLF